MSKNNIKIVNQTKPDTCAACVMAMLVGETEQYVLDWFKHYKQPFSDEDVLLFLANHGIFLGLCLKPGDGEGIDISSYDSLEFPLKLNTHRAYMIVESPTGSKLDHAVLWDGKNVLDPLQKEPQPLKNYKVKLMYPFTNTHIRRVQNGKQ